jgi:DNA-binding NtrC family response regulator
MAKILIVDAEEHIRFLYSEELTEAGYEVITADSGYKLIERIEGEKPDLIVLDIKMVDYNGLDLLQDIRNKFYDLPVVLCTAYDTFNKAAQQAVEAAESNFTAATRSTVHAVSSANSAIKNKAAKAA